MMALAFLFGVALLFALVLVCEEDSTANRTLQPASLLRWAASGNWTAKLGALLLTIGSGALLRYLMLNLICPPSIKILSGVALAMVFGSAGAAFASRPSRRAISLALSGAALAVAYLTAYSAYAFFHFVPDLQALGMLFIVAGVATTVAVTRRALSIAVLGMAGAYLAPAFALHDADPIPVYGYYAVASLVTLLMVRLRGWRPLIHLSFLFTLGGALFFGWTQQFYRPEYYGRMQPLLLALVAIHLVMPLLERPHADAALWKRRFDQAYFLALPLVAAILTLLLAPHIRREGALGLGGLAALWLAAAGWAAVQSRDTAETTRYLSVSLVLLLAAGLVTDTDVPVSLLAAVVACLAIAAGSRLKLNRATEFLAIGIALTTSAAYILQSVFAAWSGSALINLPFAEHLLLGVALLAAFWGLHRRAHDLAPVFGIYGGTWLVLTLTRELLRMQFAHLPELLHCAVLVALALTVLLGRARPIVQTRLVITLFALLLFATATASARRFPAELLLPLLVLGQVLYSLLALVCDRNETAPESDGAVARSVLPALALPWALALSRHWSVPNNDMILTILATSALAASLQAQWLVRKEQTWPNWLSPIGFTGFGSILFFETLTHIEREFWAVSFELLALTYLVETARFLASRHYRDAAVFGYIATAAVAAVSAAMLLRLIGPPGTLTVLALNQMMLPAFVSLVWAAIGAVLTWVSMRSRSRTLWSLGALLLVAAAAKLILFDFGSLGQIGNILAMISAGGVFLLVAWLAPFPPKFDERAQGPGPKQPHARA